MSLFSTISDDFGRVWRWTFGDKRPSPEYRNAAKRLLITIKNVFEKREHGSIAAHGPKHKRDAAKIADAAQWLERRGEMPDWKLAMKITGRSKDKAINRIREGLELQGCDNEWPKRPRSN